MSSHSDQAAQRARDAHRFSFRQDPDPVTATALAAEGLIHAVLAATEKLGQLVAAQASAAPTVVYRASCDTIPLGLYTTRAAARAHCLADAAEHKDDIAAPKWVGDADEVALADHGEERLFLAADGETWSESMYSVRPIDLLTAYNPDADS